MEPLRLLNFKKVGPEPEKVPKKGDGFGIAR
jgi:hypothetical protein